MSKRALAVVLWGWALAAGAATPSWASVAEEEQAASKEDEAYDRGTRALDEESWDAAIGAFDAVVRMGGKKADGALYWKAYAQNKAGRPADALATVAQLRKAAPGSRWLKEARALELEMRQSAGQRTPPAKPPL